jgi:hypothetical protein
MNVRVHPIDLLFSDNQIVTNFYTVEHPPTPFKGGFTTRAIPPLKGVGGCSTAFEISKKAELKVTV